MNMQRIFAVTARTLCAACACLALGAPSHTVAAQAAFGAWGVDLSAIDKSVRPGDNFFQFVNGTWLKTAKIPADRSSTGSFQDLQILSEKRMREIVDDLETRRYDSLSDEEKKLRDLYDAFEDEAQIERRGLEPARRDLAYLAGLRTHAEVARAMASVRLSTASIYDVGIDIDKKNPNAYSVSLTQSGLGLPDRDYYLKNDKDLAATRDAYRKYLATMLALSGVRDSKARADRIFALEIELAKVQWSRADRRDEDKTYNPMRFAALKKFAPAFPWNEYFAETGIPLKSARGQRVVVVAEKSAFPALARIFTATPVAVWRDYLRVHYLHTFSAFLPKHFDDADFALYGTVLGGKIQQLDRPTRGVRLLNARLGEALGKLYVARYFPPEAKAKADALVSNLLKAYEEDIKKATWMSDATRTKALEKIHAFTPKIGYPVRWRDYSAYVVKRDDLIGDIRRGALFEWNRELKRLDDPVDKSEWGMTPPTVNAYYNASFNEIVFPAAILQPPFFDAAADDAVNYGGIGVVIGHEISHGFDDQGSKYDGSGVFSDWWTKADRSNFDARTAILVTQFDRYEALPGLHVIGKNTLGENIADLAGLVIALNAYHLSLNAKPAAVLDGYSGDQRFFLSFGQIWRTKLRDNALRTQVLSDAHSPVEFRVNGSTRNIDAWYGAFDVQPGEKNYLPPNERVRLW